MTQKVTDDRKKITSIARVSKEVTELTEMAITSQYCRFERLRIVCLLNETTL
jgi:hypothetical protein